MSIDAGTVADHLEAGLLPLEAAIAAVDEAHSENKWALHRANEAFAQAERVVSWIGGLLENLSGLADEEVVAGSSPDFVGRH